MTCDQMTLFEFAAGEDLVVQFVWLSEDNGFPIPFQTPAVMTLADLSGNEVMVFHDGTWAGIDAINDPYLNVSPTNGMIQASAPASETSQLLPGSYNMDLWVHSQPTAGSNDYPIASQAMQICYGLVKVRNPVTLF